MSTQIDQLATELGELLLKHKGLLATAESCTGGLLAGAATANRLGAGQGLSDR